MDSGVILILLIAPIAILGIIIASRMDKKIQKEETEHELFLKKIGLDSRANFNNYLHH